MSTLRNFLASSLVIALVAGCGVGDSGGSKSSNSKDASAPSAQSTDQSDSANRVGSANDATDSNPGADFAAGMAAAGQALSAAVQQATNQMGAAGAKEPVDFRELKKSLPDTDGNVERTRTSGEKTGAMGIKVSSAEASYRVEGGGNLEVHITDSGTMAGFAAMASAGWAMAEIDREDDTSFEQTFTYKGQKAVKTYDRATRDGKISIVAFGRFVIDVTGSDVDFEQIEKLADRLPLDDLKALAETSADDTEEAEAPNDENGNATM